MINFHRLWIEICYRLVFHKLFFCRRFISLPERSGAVKADSPNPLGNLCYDHTLASISGIIASPSRFTAVSRQYFPGMASRPTSQQQSMTSGKTTNKAAGRNHKHTITSAIPVIFIPPFVLCALGAIAGGLRSPFLTQKKYQNDKVRRPTSLKLVNTSILHGN